MSEWDFQSQVYEIPPNESMIFYRRVAPTTRMTQLSSISLKAPISARAFCISGSGRVCWLARLFTQSARLFDGSSRISVKLGNSKKNWLISDFTWALRRRVAVHIARSATSEGHHSRLNRTWMSPPRKRPLLRRVQASSRALGSTSEDLWAHYGAPLGTAQILDHPSRAPKLAEDERDSEFAMWFMGQKRPEREARKGRQAKAKWIELNWDFRFARFGQPSNGCKTTLPIQVKGRIFQPLGRARNLQAIKLFSWLHWLDSLVGHLACNGDGGGDDDQRGIGSRRAHSRSDESHSAIKRHQTSSVGISETLMRLRPATTSL